MSLPHNRHCAGLLALFLLALPLCGQPSGFRKWEDRKRELRWYWPERYQQVPLAPTEQVLVARYERRTPPDELYRHVRDDRQRARYKPTLYVFSFVPQGATTGKEGDEDEETGPTNIREAMELRSRVRDFEHFLKSRLGRWEAREDPRHEGHYVLTPKRGARRGPPRPEPEVTPLSRVGYMVVERDGPATRGAFGFSWKAHEGRLRKEIYVMARSIKEIEARKKARERTREKLYRRKGFSAIEKRLQVRRGLSKGWNAVDTKNYILVHHTRNDGRGLVGRIKRNVEAMQAFYAELFPPVKPIEAVSVIRVCRSQGEYFAYGGRPGTGGYWHPGNEELVLFDYQETQRQKDRTRESSKRPRRRLSDRDSLLVLYHEAFHQYIYYAVGQVSPHDWFNEGHGDYFSGAAVDTHRGKVRAIKPSPWRIKRAKAQADGKGAVKLERLLKAERPEFYGKRKSAYYAAAWSFVYFLRDEETRQAHPEWSAMLDRYFVTLKKTYRKEIDLAGEAPDLKAKQAASKIARDKALEACLKGMDLQAIEAAWIAYVKRLKE